MNILGNAIYNYYANFFENNILKTETFVLMLLIECS